MHDKHTHRSISLSSLGEFRRIWLAGLGAVALAERHGRDWFARLVDEGERIREESATAARMLYRRAGRSLASRRDWIRERIADAAERLGRSVEDLASSLVERVGIPSRRELRELSARMMELRQRLRELAN